MEPITPQNDTPAKHRRFYPRHEKLLAAHLRCESMRQTCDETGLSRSTVQRWRRKHWAEVEAARNDAVKDAISKLRAGLTTAAERLVTVAGASTREDIAVRAAVAVIEAHSRLAERVELERRVASLEETLASHLPVQRSPPTRPSPPMQ